MTAPPPAILRRRYGPVELLAVALPEAPTRREAELAAERLLLPGLRVAHTPAGAPVLADDPARHISISHSRTHLAVALSTAGPVGIDIETPRPQLQRVAPRVLSAAELEAYGAEPDGLLRAWTLKEALYKAALTPGLDLRRDVRLPLGHKKNEAVVAPPGGSAMRFVILASCPLADGMMALCCRADAYSLVP